MPETKDPDAGYYKCLTKQQLSCGIYHIAPVSPDHIESIRIWRNSQLDVLRQMAPLSRKEQIHYYQKRIWPDQSRNKPRNILMSYFKENHLIGYGGLVHIDWDHKRAEMSYLLDPDFKRSSSEECGLFINYIQLIKKLAFEHLGFRRLFTETYDIRRTHIAILEEGGFVLEGRLRHHVLIDGKPVDSLMHGCLFQDSQNDGKECDT